MRIQVFVIIGLLFLSSAAFAEFTGPSAKGRTSTVKEVQSTPVDTYVRLTGNIVAHLKEDYYTFRDQTGEIRVEIEPPVWRNRKLGPDTKVRLIAEVDRSVDGVIYLWVESLEIVE